MGLKTGQDYYVHIRCKNKLGFGRPVATAPSYISPGGDPGVLSFRSVKPYNQNSILVTYEEITSSNGADVYGIILESGTSSSFQKNTFLLKKLPIVSTHYNKYLLSTMEFVANFYFVIEVVLYKFVDRISCLLSAR